MVSRWLNSRYPNGTPAGGVRVPGSNEVYDAIEKKRGQVNAKLAQTVYGPLRVRAGLAEFAYRPWIEAVQLPASLADAMIYLHTGGPAMPAVKWLTLRELLALAFEQGFARDATTTPSWASCTEKGGSSMCAVDFRKTGQRTTTLYLEFDNGGLFLVEIDVGDQRVALSSQDEAAQGELAMTQLIDQTAPEEGSAEAIGEEIVLRLFNNEDAGVTDISPEVRDVVNRVFKARRDETLNAPVPDGGAAGGQGGN